MKYNKFLYKLAYYFKDSYGWDKLSKYAFMTGIVLSATYYLSPIGLGLMGYATWRGVSKNKFKRYQELAAFNKTMLSLKQGVSKRKLAIGSSVHYKIFTCPNCSQKLRVPRKQGKITITCRKCNTEFKGKS